MILVINHPLPRRRLQSAQNAPLNKEKEVTTEREEAVPEVAEAVLEVEDHPEDTTIKKVVIAKKVNKEEKAAKEAAEVVPDSTTELITEVAIESKEAASSHTEVTENSEVATEITIEVKIEEVPDKVLLEMIWMSDQEEAEVVSTLVKDQEVTEATEVSSEAVIEATSEEVIERPSVVATEVEDLSEAVAVLETSRIEMITSAGGTTVPDKAVDTKKILTDQLMVATKEEITLEVTLKDHNMIDLNTIDHNTIDHQDNNTTMTHTMKSHSEVVIDH